MALQGFQKVLVSKSDVGPSGFGDRVNVLRRSRRILLIDDAERNLKHGHNPCDHRHTQAGIEIDHRQRSTGFVL